MKTSLVFSILLLRKVSLVQEGGGGGGGGWDKIVRNVGINALFLCGYFLIDGGGGFFGGGGGGGGGMNFHIVLLRILSGLISMEAPL